MSLSLKNNKAITNLNLLSLKRMLSIFRSGFTNETVERTVGNCNKQNIMTN